ncbi:MAG: FAD-dependent oxidoreductase [Pseudomonadales bacterium]
MSQAPATEPVRVAIVGSGPAGFYAVAALRKQRDFAFDIDMFDRLPVPFGLIRAGVAPDHQKDKTVTRNFDRLAREPGFRFFGGVEYGRHLHLQDLRRHYQLVVFCTGAQTDRRLGIPGEDLAGSHSATEFVAWYNGHPDFADRRFDLSCASVAVIGLGNVAVDVARMLCKSAAELAATDMADYAIDALGRSGVREVCMLGRRGPAQAAFSPSEIQELGALAEAEVAVPADEARVDAESQADLDRDADRNAQKNVQAIQAFAEAFAKQSQPARRKRLTLRFLVSPIELLGDDQGRVRALRLARNRMVRGADGLLRPEPTGEIEELPAGLVLRSVGYRGVALPGLPFDEARGVIRNVHGRVLVADDRPLTGVYTAGWIKRGPTGVIGTNKTDALETVTGMVDDLRAGRVNRPEQPDPDAVVALLRQRGVRVVSYPDWLAIDEHEQAMGARAGRPRVKLTAREAMLALLDRER